MGYNITFICLEGIFSSSPHNSGWLVSPRGLRSLGERADLGRIHLCPVVTCTALVHTPAFTAKGGHGPCNTCTEHSRPKFQAAQLHKARQAAGGPSTPGGTMLTPPLGPSHHVWLPRPPALHRTQTSRH